MCCEAGRTGVPPISASNRSVHPHKGVSMRLPSRFRASLGAGALATCLVAVGCSSSSATPPAAEPGISVDDAANRQEALRTDMRKLWEDHVTWTRLFIVSALAGAQDTDATAQR